MNKDINYTDNAYNTDNNQSSQSSQSNRSDQSNAAPDGVNQGLGGDLSSNLSNYYGQPDDAFNFDLIENPQNWPDDPAIQAELAELLEIHLAMQAHADEVADALNPTKGFRRFVGRWILPAAAILLAILPTLYAVSNIQETRRMRARGAVLETEIQKRLSTKLWYDFFSGSLDLLEQVKTPAKFCDISNGYDIANVSGSGYGAASVLKREDRSYEVEQARRLYAMGRSLPLDALNEPEALDARKNLQNWLTEVSANDTCMSPERSLELLNIAREMNLEGKAYKLNRKLREEYS